MSNARELAAGLRRLLRREQGAMADFLVALADFDRRRLWVELGHTSLFYFLHRELKLSAGAAYLRKTAAELIQRFPDLVEPLREGRLCLSSVGELSKVMTAENRGDVLPRFFHASKAQAKAVAAELAPRAAPPLRAVLTQVAPRSTSDGLAPPAAGAGCSHQEAGAGLSLALGQAALHPGETGEAPARSAAASFAPPPSPRSTAEPLTADLRRLHVTVSKRFLEKLDAARDALSHSHPGADAATILEAGLDLLIERAAKRKGIVQRPRTPKAAPSHGLPERSGESGASRNSTAEAREMAVSLDGEEAESRHIPAAVKREVWIRDAGRCQFRLENGELCGSTNRVQFDQVVPHARGGQATVANVRLRCAGHNLLEARRVFGDSLMDRYAPARAAGAPGAMR